MEVQGERVPGSPYFGARVIGSRRAENGDFSTENGHSRQAAGAFGIAMPANSVGDSLPSLPSGGPELKRVGHGADKP
jgi:hypothetical protein